MFYEIFSNLLPSGNPPGINIKEKKYQWIVKKIFQSYHQKVLQSFQQNSLKRSPSIPHIFYGCFQKILRGFFLKMSNGFLQKFLQRFTKSAILKSFRNICTCFYIKCSKYSFRNATQVYFSIFLKILRRCNRKFRKYSTDSSNKSSSNSLIKCSQIFFRNSAINP